MLFGIVGCNFYAGGGSKESTPTLEPVTYPLTVTELDNNVTIDAEPERVVSCAPNITELIYKLGAQDKIVGRTDYCDYPEEVASVESIGTLTEPDIEKIVSLQPDVVFTSTHFTDENQKKLEDLGVKVVHLYDQNKMDGVYDIITVMGNILNRQAVAEAVMKEMKDSINNITEAVKDKEPVSVYYVVGYGDDGDYTAGGDTFINELITTAGGDNIAKDVNGWSYSIESLIEKDPECIFVGNGMKEGFMKADKYKELTAVKEDKVYEIDQNLFDRQGYRNAQGITLLATILHG